MQKFKSMEDSLYQGTDGQIPISRTDFYRIGGFQTDFGGYGFGDIDRTALPSSTRP